MGLALTLFLAAAPACKPAFRPNFVVILTDDQAMDEMWAMPKTLALLGTQGTTFSHAYVTESICCPSRASLMTGQFPHNDGVRDNLGLHGGYYALDWNRTLGTWLHGVGYHTTHVGKTLNGFGKYGPAVSPPGWDNWTALLGTSTGDDYRYFDYDVFDNGATVHHGTAESDYLTDVLADRAISEINDSVATGRPFFLDFPVLGPHSDGHPSTIPFVPPIPAPRHASMFADATFPHPPSYFEADVSDKPAGVRQWRQGFEQNIAAGYTQEWIDNFIDSFYRARLQSLQSVDDAVERIYNTLRDSGKLENTIIVFTSDNGFLYGQHDLALTKFYGYERSANVPLIVRGPGFTPGATVDSPVSLADVATTMISMTDIKINRVQDGRSLSTTASDPAAYVDRAILIEGREIGEPAFEAVRTPGWYYAEWLNGETELYDMTADPDQMNSQHANPAYDVVKAALASLLHTLVACGGETCLQSSAAIPAAP